MKDVSKCGKCANCNHCQAQRLTEGERKNCLTHGGYVPIRNKEVNHG